MPLSDSDFLAWARSARQRPVVLVEFNVTDETESPQLLRVATRRYTTATHVYRGRLVDFELDWEMEPGVVSSGSDSSYSGKSLIAASIVMKRRFGAPEAPPKSSPCA